MKTIFITISRGGTARNLLQTEFYKILKKSKNRLVILTSAWKDGRFIKEFGADNVYFENLVEPKWTIFDGFLVGWHKALVYNNSTKKRDLYGIYDPKEGSFLKYAFKKFLFWPLSKIRFLKDFFRRLDGFARKDIYFGNIFDKYKPDIVFSTSIMEDADSFVIKQAKARGIKTIGMPKTWDNTSKMLFRAKTDKLIVWGRFSKDEAMKFQNYTPEDIIVCGIPQFDFYKNTEYLLTKKEFCAQSDINENKKIIVFCSEGKTTKHDGEIAEMIANFINDKKLKKDAVLFIRPHFMYPDDEKKFEKILGRENVILDKGYEHSLTFRDRWDYSAAQIKKFTNIICHADIVITSYSSISLDAAAFDKPIINIAFDGYKKVPFKESMVHWYNMEYYKHVVESGGVWMVDSEPELLNAINNYLLNSALLEDGRKKLREFFMHKTDGQSGRRIAEEVLNYLEN